jgi:uncharacterized membrane protein
VETLVPLLMIVAALPFVLPIVSLVRQAGLRRRIQDLEQALEQQQYEIDALTARLARQQEEAPSAAAAVPPRAAEAPRSAAETARPAGETPRPAVEPPPSAIEPPKPLPAPEPPAIAPGSRSDAPTPSRPPVTQPPPMPEAPPAVPVAAYSDPVRSLVDQARERWFTTFDWEQLVGVKLFSGIAGVALVLAAIFFFRYSLDRGWLAAPVRVVIGVVVATALIVVCQLRAARRYPITANALDAAAIAILFATFFAAHALWDLIPATVTFALLALVTVLAVVLSIVHDAMFIAVLGLVGGFATPALLSTGENQPVPLFTYLLLLNVGLAWVAVRKKWPVLSVLSLALTAIYQWGWVATFLWMSDLSLAMGIFLLFAIVSFASLTMSRKASGGVLATILDRTTVAATAMPLLFAVFLAAVPRYGAHSGLLFGFLLIVVGGLSAVAIVTRDDRPHLLAGVATLLVFALWLGLSYASSSWRLVVIFTVVLAAWFALAPLLAARLKRPFGEAGSKVVYASTILLVVFSAIARLEPATASPAFLFGALFAVLALIAWRSLATLDTPLYLVAAFFALTAEAMWTATHFTPDRIRALVALYAAFGLFYLGVPIAWRRRGRAMTPRWAPGAVVLASLAMLEFLAAGPQVPAALWGLGLLLAILDAGLFIESAAAGLPLLSLVGGGLSWLVLGGWWINSADAVGTQTALLVLVGLTLVMFAGHGWAASRRPDSAARPTGFRNGLFLGLAGQLFVAVAVQSPQWAVPPWPVFGALTVMTLAASAAALYASAPALHAAGVIAAAAALWSYAAAAPTEWAMTAIAAIEAAAIYGVLALAARRARRSAALVAAGAAAALFISECALISARGAAGAGMAALIAAHAGNLSVILWIAWEQRWPYVAEAAVAPAWFAVYGWRVDHRVPSDWRVMLAFASTLYAVFAAYPLVLARRARARRSPYYTAVLGSLFFLFAGRSALVLGQLNAIVGIVPIGEGIVLAFILRGLLRAEPPTDRDLGRLAVVAGATLACATVAIPLQLNNQWITIGWALEGAALAWLYRRVPHKGLLYATAALFAVVFARLVLNPAVFVYEPRGAWRVFNWYLYAYSICAAAMFAATWLLAKTEDRLLPALPRLCELAPVAATIMLFWLLNIEVADYYATGPEITFRFGVTLAQDLTYTLAWLVFGMLLLAAGIYWQTRAGRVAAVVLIATTALKAFLYDMGSLGGLYRVGSLVGLAASLALVALALQKFVLLSRQPEHP